ncbi:MAG TPA: FG-GAP-like repeat-containing protein [Chloroflexia bacterium]|nr:FG-GAP-like repeat-containing protein [Chloroflexia bacterium]
MRRIVGWFFVIGAALALGIGLLLGGARPAPAAARLAPAPPAPVLAPRPLAASVPLTLCGQLAFSQPSGSPDAAGSQPIAITTGDFDVNGLPDLAVANFSDNTVTVLLGVGGGNFRPAPNSPFAVGTGPAAVVARDFNGDRLLDLAVVNTLSNNVTILLGNGLGGFTPAPGSPIPVGSGPHAIAAGDVNGDGFQDLVVANVLSNDVTVLLGNGQGGFTPAPGSPVAVGTNPFAIALGLLNGDTHLDLVTANYSANTASVLLGNGAGGFSPAPGSPVAVGAGPSALAIGNVNGDAVQDLVVANASDNTVSVLLGTGNGSFTPAAGSPLTVGNHPEAVVLRDLDGDGFVDLAVANSGADQVEVLLGNGAGGFSPAPLGPVATGHRPTGIAAADYDRDGKLDLATANAGSDNVTVLLNSCGQPTPTPGPPRTATPTAVPSPSPTYPAGTCSTESFSRALGAPFPVDNGPAALVAGDFNGDGVLDLATANFGANDVSLLLGTGSGGFSPAPGSPFSVGSGPQGLTVGDFNRDGKLDLATANFGANTVSVLLGNGAGGFSQAPGSPVAVGAGPWALASGDFNGDGFADLAVANLNAGTLSILLGTGTGSFTAAPGSPIAVGLNPDAVAVGDFNHDGRRDLAVASFSANTVLILLGNGAGGFTAIPGGPIPVGTNPVAIAVGDLNSDNNPDLAVANAGAGTVSILLGNGSGGFTPESTALGVGSGPQAVAIADVNGDGRRDLIVANAGADTVSVLLGNGGGGFSPAAGSPYPTGNRPAGIAVGDFNHDGAADLAVANGVSADVTVLLNSCLPPTPTPCAISFSDVHASDYFYTPVLYLACRGVISGYADNTFRPYNQTTRSQQVKIVILGFGVPIVTPPAGGYTFTDVPPGFPFFGVIETAAAHQIVSGYTCGGPNEPCDSAHRPYFRPYANVTRGQLSKITAVTAGWQLIVPPTATFSDVAPGTAFYTFVETAVCHGIISGYACGGPGEPCDSQNRPYFRQFANATRGQIAKIVYGALTSTQDCTQLR